MIARQFIYSLLRRVIDISSPVRWLSIAQKMMRYKFYYKLYKIHKHVFKIIVKIVFQDYFADHRDEYIELVPLSHG